MRKEFLIFGSPDIGEEEIRDVVDSLRSGWIGTGPKVASFEADFANYKGVDSRSVAALSSCTAALHLSLIAAGIGPGDEVITSALTFCATINAIIHTGATPVLADIDPKTMNIDPDDVTLKITSKTRAIVPVHFAGRCCDMDATMDIAGKHHLTVIEDCAHAIESEYKGRKAGTFGDFGCFSFYVTKNVVTGEGGMAIAKDEDNIARIKRLALHGLSEDAWHRFSDSGYKHYKVMDCGFKYNMMDIQAAIGIHQLKRIEKNWIRRQEIWSHYQKAFSTLHVALPPEPEPETRHAYHLYTLLIDKNLVGIDRDSFLEAMTKLNIGVGVHYLSIPEHPFYQDTFKWRAEDYPNAMRTGRQTVSLPMSTKISDGDLEYIIRSVKELLS